MSLTWDDMNWIPLDTIAALLGLSIGVWLALLLVFIIVPATFGVSLGVRRMYMKTLLLVFEWATLRIERGIKEQKHRRYRTNLDGIIKKEACNLEDEIVKNRRPGHGESNNTREEFELADVIHFCRRGVESIVDDEVTTRFSAEELESWNLLTRSNNNFQYISLRLTILWGLGVAFRYGFLLPLRLTLAFIGISWLVIGTTVVSYLPNGRARRSCSELVHLMSMRICSRALTAIITYYNRENIPKKGGICVANHTSPIDTIILANHRCYAMVGQKHGGILGLIQRSIVKTCPHVFFERSEAKDRFLVTQRLSDHIADGNKLPILIFPEGTCINNTSVMMFKKGSFEIGGVIYPVAIKYDPHFGDAFWNSSKYGMVNYLLRMMSSWAIVCNVWYLPPMTCQHGENAVQFANRVKAEIARKGGLVDLVWDGGLKRAHVKTTMKEEQQKQYSKTIVGN
uniref:glycerol-3-phosphate acyltransferase 4-like n=1 Tax=Myxine glutinosa TaxID=7769 RepID=UPI00358DDABF